jgi:hypothetical protein
MYKASAHTTTLTHYLKVMDEFRETTAITGGDTETRLVKWDIESAIETD